MVWPARLKDSFAPGTALAAAAGSLGTGGVAEALLIVIAAAAGGVALSSARRERNHASASAAAAAAAVREAVLVSETAVAILTNPAAGAVSPRLERKLAEAGARLQLCHAPTPRSDEIALPLRADTNVGWLYVNREGPLTRTEAERVLSQIGELIRAARDRKRAHDAAAAVQAERQAELAKTAVMHAISHDLRGPLEAIQGATGELPLDGAVKDAIGRETAKLELIADDLLDLSRIEAGATNPQRDLCDLSEVVGAAAEHVRSEHHEVSVDLRLSDDLPRVHADRKQLERVFCNLLDNAAKFSSPDRPIEVRGIAANGRVTIRVLDHGRGISRAQQSQVFKAFVRGSSTESGSGLGLAICRGFVEANGGRITLQSGARDGSAFAVSFPATKQHALVS